MVKITKKWPVKKKNVNCICKYRIFIVPLRPNWLKDEYYDY